MSERGFIVIAAVLVLAGGCYNYSEDSGSDTGSCDDSGGDDALLSPECSADYDLLCYDENFHFEPGSCYIVQLGIDGAWTAYETTSCPWAS